jgi:hypothetical protein
VDDHYSDCPGGVQAQWLLQRRHTRQICELKVEAINKGEIRKNISLCKEMPPGSSRFRARLLNLHSFYYLLRAHRKLYGWGLRPQAALGHMDETFMALQLDILQSLGSWDWQVINYTVPASRLVRLGRPPAIAPSKYISTTNRYFQFSWLSRYTSGGMAPHRQP